MTRHGHFLLALNSFMTSATLSRMIHVPYGGVALFQYQILYRFAVLSWYPLFWGGPVRLSCFGTNAVIMTLWISAPRIP